MTEPQPPHGERAIEPRAKVPPRWYALACAALLLGCSEAPTQAPRAPVEASDTASETSAPAAAGSEADEALVAEAAAFAARFPRGVSPDAKLDTDELLRIDLEAPRHPSDGGGRACFADPKQLQRHVAGSIQRFELVYEAGPLGIAEGGQIILQASPFWGWDPPQAILPDLPGYTEFETDAAGVVLEAGEPHPELLSIVVGGRGLEAGEQVRIVFGAGRAGVRVDRFAEKDERIFFSVDGDGDGVRSLLDELPGLETVAGPPRQLEITLPTTAEPGAPIALVVSLLDQVGNVVEDASGELVVANAGEAASWAFESIALEPAHAGRRRLELSAPAAGIHRLRLEGRGALHGLVGESNPMLVRPDVAPVFWGDLHGHSQLSDGTGTADQYFTYAREVAGLDFAALTDHDHWGMRFLDSSPPMWSGITETVRRHHAPARFVTLLGYEWTSWLHGHRHVLYFGDSGEVYSSIDPETDSPDELWAALAGQSAMTFAHHSAGGPIATNWRYPPDPVLEPITEIVSVHGSSEADDAPSRIYSPVAGNFVRDTLSAGYVFGFIGSSDSHDGHPGLAHLSTAPGLGGLAAVRATRLERADLLAALRGRNTYATNGARIYLDVRIDGRPMGSLIDAAEPDASTQQLEIEVIGTAPIERVELIRSGRNAPIEVEGLRQWRHSRAIPPLLAGEYHYVRVVQEDQRAAWSSPIYAR